MGRTSIQAAGSLIAIAAAMFTWLDAARADVTISSACVGSGRSSACSLTWHRHSRTTEVLLWTPRAEREAREAEARDKLWLARCRPTTEYDQYGMKRFRYAAAGCEFGRYED